MKHSAIAVTDRALTCLSRCMQCTSDRGCAWKRWRASSAPCRLQIASELCKFRNAGVTAVRTAWQPTARYAAVTVSATRSPAILTTHGYNTRPHTLSHRSERPLYCSPVLLLTKSWFDSLPFDG